MGLVRYLEAANAPQKDEYLSKVRVIPWSSVLKGLYYGCQFQRASSAVCHAHHQLYQPCPSTLDGQAHDNEFYICSELDMPP